MTGPEMAARLRAEGAHVRDVEFKDNRRTFASFGSATLRLHAGFRGAPHDPDAWHALVILARRMSGDPSVTTYGYKAAVGILREWIRPHMLETRRRHYDAARKRAHAHHRAIRTPSKRRKPCVGTPAQLQYLRQRYAAVRAEVRAWLVGRLRDDLAAKLPTEVPIRVSNRMSRKLGHCQTRTVRQSTGAYTPAATVRHVAELAFNVDLFLPENAAELEETIRHEIAHAFAFVCEGERGHGRRWRTWARICGARPQRCADGHIASRDRKRHRTVTHAPSSTLDTGLVR